MRVRVLASGSKGNATLFESAGFSLLLDAGISPAEFRVRAPDAPTPNALLVTHAHSDHSGFASSWKKKASVPIWMSEATARAIPSIALHRFAARGTFAIGPFTIQTIPLPHDAAQVAVAVSDGFYRAVLATDLGEVPPALPELLTGAHAVLIESNHDRYMLEHGPYPRFLKQRVASSRGHLSNEQTHQLLRRLPHSVETVVLLHLSEKNNTPELALDAAADALSDRPVRLLAAMQHRSVSVELHRPWPSPAALRTPRKERKLEAQLSLPLGGER